MNIRRIASLAVLATWTALAGCSAPVAPPEPATPPRFVDPAFADPAGPELVVRVVLEDGVTPVAGCRIGVSRENATQGRNGWTAVRTPIAEHVTDAAGYARFGNVAAGKVVVAAGLAGEERGILEFAALPASGPPVGVVLRIRGMADVEGTVVGPSGPRVGIEMQLARAATAKTDAHGRYAFRGIALGHAPTVQLALLDAKWHGTGSWGRSAVIGLPLQPGTNEVAPLRLDHSGFAKSLVEAFVHQTWPPVEPERDERR